MLRVSAYTPVSGGYSFKQYTSPRIELFHIDFFSKIIVSVTYNCCKHDHNLHQGETLYQATSMPLLALTELVPSSVLLSKALVSGITTAALTFFLGR